MPNALIRTAFFFFFLFFFFTIKRQRQLSGLSEADQFQATGTRVAVAMTTNWQQLHHVNIMSVF